uniref:Uncharacterized protein n=1 Tax=Cryptomonas curvata TaxID=233186 RepID=A0A7S0MCY4_9CRYP|mmetsp:Transcript_35492/g.74276  ORF Transcript_35492/g.74276 Transcript_35492/m.74276 type:complete len:158 (+) Transcript_35492:1-474(+)
MQFKLVSCVLVFVACLDETEGLDIPFLRTPSAYTVMPKSHDITGGAGATVKGRMADKERRQNLKQTVAALKRHRNGIILVDFLLAISDVLMSPVTQISAAIVSCRWGVNRVDSSVRSHRQSIERGADSIASGLVAIAFAIIGTAVAIITTALINKGK